MAKIRQKKVTLRSKYVYLTEKFGRLGGSFIALGLAVVFFVLLFIYFRHTDNLSYLRFGRPGLVPFFLTFPYFLFITFVILVAVAAFIISRIYYKKPFILLLVILSAAVLLAGASTIMAGVPGFFTRYAFNSRQDMMVRPFLHPGLRDKGPGVAGVIMEKDGCNFVLANFCREFTLRLARENDCLAGDLQAGDFVVGVGQWQGDDFLADSVKIVPQEHLKMVVGDKEPRLAPPPDSRLRPDEWRPKNCF